MDADKNYPAYAMHRRGKRFRWVEVGFAKHRSDGSGFDVFLDRMPVGGFNGHVDIRTDNTKPSASIVAPEEEI
jgi:hypothetical protein